MYTAGHYVLRAILTPWCDGTVAAQIDLDKLWSEYRPSEGVPVGAAAAIAEDCFYVSIVERASRRSALKRRADLLFLGQAGVSGWTTDGSPLMVERLGRADLAGITREGEDLQRLVLYSCVFRPYGLCPVFF